MLVDTGSLTPFGRKFGCAPEVAADLLGLASELGLKPAGVSFHVGSQQLNPTAWDAGIAAAAGITATLAAGGIELPLINIGGGVSWPVHPTIATSGRLRRGDPRRTGAAWRLAPAGRAAHR
jgi:diaminopimelate decarboxylase